MKVNELMIGDWVYNKNIDKPMQVNSTMFSQIFRRNPDATSEDFNIFSVPLTAEILAQNGFERDSCYQYIYKDNYCKVCVSFAPRMKIDSMDLGEPPINVNIKGALFDINMNMSAIHTLQHVLKLCEIDKEIVL